MHRYSTTHNLIVSHVNNPKKLFTDFFFNLAKVINEIFDAHVAGANGVGTGSSLAYDHVKMT